MNWKIVLIAGVILFSGTARAQGHNNKQASKTTVPPAVQDHRRWVMDKKSWGLPNAADIKATQSAAHQGFAPAQFKLSLMYERGYGVLPNDTKAVKWLRRAAEQNFVEAQFNLGSRYESGQGVTQDYAEAANWFRKAAEQGYAGAQKNLGALYGRGRGVPQDFSKAYIWSSIAVKSGDKSAIRNRNLSANELSQDDLQISEKRASGLYEEFRQKSIEYLQKHPD
jgi:TPR repeat protein